MPRRRDIDRLQSVFGHRERRRRQEVSEVQRRLDLVHKGLSGAREIRSALHQRLTNTQPGNSSAGAFAAAQTHARLLGAQLQEIERLQQQAQARGERVRVELANARRRWQRAQYRLDHMAGVNAKLQQQQTVRAEDLSDDEANERWQHATQYTESNK